jgi:nucleotide-binding universal stress UspA family protein
MYRKILVPVDGSDAARRGLIEALKLASGVGAQVRILHVVNTLLLDARYPSAEENERLLERLREAGAAVLSEAEAIAKREGVAVEPKLVEARGVRAADVIIEQAQVWGADLIAMGTHGRRGLRRLALGSDAELVLRASPTPVLLAREPGQD